MSTNISKEYPPVHIYQPCVDKFGADFKKGIVFAYNGTIYCNEPDRISPDLMAHEETHLEQQKLYGADAWWLAYLNDPQFRLSQELEAYRNQYQYAVENYSRPHRRYLLQTISRLLSSSLYGNLLSTAEAKNLIKNQ